jgi:GDPmannose 4,6-dehydratase
LGNLEAMRDWGFAGDYVEAMWMILQHPQADDFVIATGETHSVREFMELAFEKLELDWREHVQFDQRLVRPAEVDILQGDASKARKALGWQPKVSFKELVGIMIDADMELARRELKAEG